MNIVQLVVNRNPPFTKWVKKMSGFFGLAILAGLFCGMLCLTPLGLYLEEELGLAWLFSMRGQVPPPSQVVIISVDQMSAETLHLPDDPEKWPRDYYARLIDQINRQEPALIALNMVFNENRELQSDRKLAEAIKAKRNVILGNYLKHKIIPMSGNVEAVSYESLIESIDIINAAALASAPFLVPKTSSTVKQFWTNKDSAGDLSTFPDVVFQCYVLKQAYPEIMALLKQVDPKLAATFPGRFDEFSNDHAILEKIGGLLATFIRFNGNTEKLSTLLAANPFPLPTKQLLDAWLGLLDNHKSLYLNHYGNVGAIETIPFFQALEHLTPDILRNKIVMVGFSETIEPEKNLGFYSVFSNANGQTVSPIEIAATAVANLLDNTWLKPLDASRQFWLLLVWGCLLSGLCSLLAYRWAIALMMVLSAIYAYVAFYVFVHQQFWLPLVIPLGLQMPLLLIAASVLQFRKTHQAKYKMQLVLGHLLPKEIVDKIPHQPENLAMDTGGKMLQGICMATDVSDYTKLSESLEPDQLIDCMNAYYAAIFPLVNDNGGYVTDLAGDGMYAVWLNSEQLKHVRIKACAAALQIRESICQFNVTRQPQLITRFGLVCGDISIGHTGAPGRYVYRAIGDPVNTASRVEGLNKYLGTQILVTESVITGITDFLQRDLGFFMLKGKSKPVHVFELLMYRHEADSRASALVARFSVALGLFQSHQWSDALQLFVTLAQDYPEDGPAQFYISHLQAMLCNMGKMPEEGQAYIDISLLTGQSRY